MAKRLKKDFLANKENLLDFAPTSSLTPEGRGKKTAANPPEPLPQPLGTTGQSYPFRLDPVGSLSTRLASAPASKISSLSLHSDLLTASHFHRDQPELLK